MASTLNQEFPEINPTQLGKATTANTTFNGIDLAMSELLSIQADDGVHTSPYTVPYETGDEPTRDKSALRFFVMKVSGALASSWTFYLPVGPKKVFLVENLTTGGFDVVATVDGGTGVHIPPGDSILCYLNGTDVEELPISAATGSQPWDIGNFIDGGPLAGQVVMRWIATRTLTFPGNFANNQMYSEFAAAGTAVWTVNKNGVMVGSATFSGGDNTPVWFTADPTVVYHAGDVGTFIAPNPADLGLANIVWAFAATR